MKQSGLSLLDRWRKLPLWSEITVVLLIKIILLTCLWKVFFSHPQAEHMRLPEASVEQRLLSTTPLEIDDAIQGNTSLSQPQKARAPLNKHE